MTRRILLCALLLIAGTQSLSAKEPEVDYERKSDNSVVFYLEGDTKGMTYTIEFSFKDMRNTNFPTGEIRREARNNRQPVLTLKPVDPKRPITFSWSYGFILGRVNPKIDTSFVYRMPVQTLRPTRVRYVTDIYDFLKDSIKSDKDKTRIGYHFDMQQGDTVYAMRRGHVVRIRHRQPEMPRSNIKSTTAKTEVRIEHPDGTFARYVGLDDAHVLVEEDTDVMPGTPLALAGTTDGEEYGVSMQLYYATLDPKYKKDDNRYAQPRPFFPIFATTDGAVRLEFGKTYTATMNDELRLRELSKKELRKAKQLQEKR